MGKTRLAFELAEAVLKKQPGWLAGQVQTMSELKAIPLGEKGTLLIIDYPEQHTEAIKDFCESLKRMAEPKNLKLRILLLARRENANTVADALITRRDKPMQLSALAPEDSQGWHIFEAAWQKIRSLKEMPTNVLPLDQASFEQWQKSDKLHLRPLFIIAFALHLSECPSDIRLQGPAIIRELVNRERQRLKIEIDKLNKNRTEMGEKPLQFEALQLLFALAGIVGQLNKNAIAALQAVNCDDIQIPSPRELDKTSLWRAGGIPALQPDLLAAQLLNDELNNEFISPGPWLLTCLIFSGDRQKIAESLSQLGRLRFDHNILFASNREESEKRESEKSSC